MVKANEDNNNVILKQVVKSLEKVIYGMLSERTKQDAEWWKNKMRNDLFLTAEELVEIGVIDQII